MQTILQEIMKKNNTLILSGLVNETILQVTQIITLGAEMFGAGDHQNFLEALISKNLCWIFIEMKHLFGKKWSKMANSKINEFFKISNFQKIFAKILD